MSTLDVAVALARLVEVEADRAGKQWHPQGVVAQLRKLLEAEPALALDDLLVAACAAARDPEALTPAAIGWAKYRRPTARPVDGRLRRCRWCGQLGADACAHVQRRVGEELAAPHEYEPEEPRIHRSGGRA